MTKAPAKGLARALFAAGLACSWSASAPAGQFELKLSVTEPGGVARRAEPCSGGVPLPKGAFKKGQSFALYKAGGGEVPCQVLPLVFRKDGSMRWALLDFQDDLAAGGTVSYVLRAAEPGAEPASPLKTAEGADGVTVDTGKIKFAVSKSRPFGLFSSVQAGGKPVVSGGRITCREHFTGKDYTAGAPASIVVEHRGPMRVTIAVKGPFTGDERGKLTYAARITAWAGKSSVHVQYSLCNSVEAHYCFRSVKDSSIALKLAGKPGGSLLGAAAPLQAGAEARVAASLLARHVDDAARAWDGDKQVWSSKKGQEPQGWIAARTDAGTVWAADLYFAADPARQLAVKAGELVLSGVIERRAGEKDSRGREAGAPYADNLRVLYDCSHLSSQYLIDFAAPAAPAELARMARAGTERVWIACDPGAYLHGDAVFSGKFGTQADEMACYQAWKWKYNEGDAPQKPHRRYPRFFRGIDNHFDPEEDIVNHLVLMYMRTGKRAYWSHLRSWGNYWADLCAWRTDGWRWKDGGVWKRSGPKGSRPQRPPDPVTGIREIMPTGDGGSDGRTFSMKRSGSKKLPIALSKGFVQDNYLLGIYKGCYCHNWSMGMIHLFCLTGDHDFLEAGLDRSEQGLDQELRAFGRKEADGKWFGRSFTRTSMNAHAARMFQPEDEFFRKGSDRIAAVFKGRKPVEPRGLVNAGGRAGLDKPLEHYVGKQGVKALEESGGKFDRGSSQMTDKAGNKWYIIKQPATWMYPPQSKAMYRYWLETGDEDARDWTVAYGQAVARVLYQRHGNFDYSRFIIDFPQRGVARDFGSWTTDPETNPWAEGPAINAYLARFHPDICARAYALSGEKILKERARDLLFGGTHRGYNSPKMKPLDRVGMWMNYYSDHDGQIDFMLKTFYIWAHQRKDAQPPKAVSDLKVNAAGETATVTFTAPADAGGGRVVRYQVKCSERPILGYEKYLEAFNKFEEGKATNWWMAANLAGEPAPKAPGAKESFTVTGVPKDARYFAVRSFDESSNRSAMSNLAGR